MSELITVIRYIEQDPQLVLRSQAGDPAGVQAWANGNEVRVTLGKFELALPWAIASAIADVLDDRLDEYEAAPPAPAKPHPGPSSIIGRSPEPTLTRIRGLSLVEARARSLFAKDDVFKGSRVVRWEQLSAAERSNFTAAARAQLAAESGVV